MKTRRLIEWWQNKVARTQARKYVREGWEMSEREDRGAIQSISILSGAELIENQGKIERAKARGNEALQTRDRLEEFLRQQDFDPSAHLQTVANGKADLFWALGLFVLNGALAFLALVPFGPLWIVLPLSLLVLASALPVEEFFQAHEERATLREGLFLVTSVLALGAQCGLATVRGLLFEMSAPVDSGPVTHAMAAAAPIFRVVLAIFASVGEVLCGFLVFRARKALLSGISQTVRARDRLNRELVDLHVELEVAKAKPAYRRALREVGVRQCEASKAGAEQRAKSKHLHHAILGALIVLTLILTLFFLVPDGFGATAPRRNVVALIDLTESISEDGFRANVQAINEIFPRLGTGDRVVVLGIADAFGSTQLLMDRKMPAQSGYLGFGLQAARETLAADWRKLATGLPSKHKFARTDLIGALAFLPYISGLSSANTFVFVFSDLRQSTPDLNLENTKQIPVDRSLEQARRSGAVPALKGATVFLLGVNPTEKTANYFVSLKSFWTRYFNDAGARVSAFTIDRAIPEF